MRTARFRLSPFLLAGVSLLAAAAVANPGASGGSAPSITAPSFDAAAEYRKGIEALKANQFAEAS
jgi:hypothetical protein